MKTLKLLAAIVSLGIAGCTLTSEPTVFDKFETNQGDSYARTMMRRAGSNKFIDSEKGENNTREVAGTTAMNVAQLATLDLVGFLTNSALNSQIENEPLSKESHIFVSVNSADETEAQNLANIYMMNLIKESGFEIKDKSLKPAYVIYFLSGEACQSLPNNDCQIGLNNPKVRSVDLEKQTSVVAFTGISTSKIVYLSQYADENFFAYNPVKQGLYYQSYTPKPFVIHNQKAYYFLKGQSFEEGVSLSDILVK